MSQHFDKGWEEFLTKCWWSLTTLWQRTKENQWFWLSFALSFGFTFRARTYIDKDNLARAKSLLFWTTANQKRELLTMNHLLWNNGEEGADTAVLDGGRQWRHGQVLKCSCLSHELCLLLLQWKGFSTDAKFDRAAPCLLFTCGFNSSDSGS